MKKDIESNKEKEQEKIEFDLNQLDSIFEDLKNDNVLNLSNIYHDDKAIMYLKTNLNSHVNLTSINLTRCNIKDSGAYIISQLLVSNSTVKKIDIESNEIEVLGCSYIAQALYGNTTLEYLNLSGNSITSIGAQNLASSLLVNKTLTYLNVSKQAKGKKIGPDGATALARVLAVEQSNLKTLIINRNNIGFEGIRHISAALYSNNTLHELDVGGINYFSIAGALQLAQSVSVNSKLEYLTVGEYRIPLFDIKGQEYISDNGLVVSPREKIVLDKDEKIFKKEAYEGMQDEMAIVIVTLLKENQVLKSFTIFGKELLIQELIGNNLKGDQITTSLNLSNKGYKSIHTIIIGGLISTNPYLTQIDLSDNDFASTEGENFIAFALKFNPKIRMDTVKWPPSRMFLEGYKALASLMGLSASGAIIEPQRLEGCFYRGLTAISALFFYIGLATDINTIYSFATYTDLYPPSYWIISLCFLCTPTILFAYNTFRNLIFHDIYRAFVDTFTVLFQLSSFYHARECVDICCETAEMLDYKFTQGVYKTIPQICFQMYVLFRIGINEGIFAWSVLLSIMTSIISIVIIFIMLFDRIKSRRMSMLPLSVQPYCAVVIANAYVCCGMGIDDEYVEGLVNFNSFYTSHYTWSYVFQLFSILSRSVSIIWLLAYLTFKNILIVIGYLFLSRLLIIYLFDKLFHMRPISTNIIKAVSLFISDSTWTNETLMMFNYYDDPTVKELAMERIKNVWISIMILTSCENIVCLVFNAFIYDKYSKIPYSDGENLFIGIIIMMAVRWFFVFHWLLPIHFHNFEENNNFEDIVISQKNKRSLIRRNKGENLSSKRKALQFDSDYKYEETNDSNFNYCMENCFLRCQQIV